MKNKMLEKCWMSRQNTLLTENKSDMPRAKTVMTAMTARMPGNSSSALQFPTATTTITNNAISMRCDMTLEATVAPGISSRGNQAFWIKFWLPSMAPIDSMMLACHIVKGSIADRYMSA